MILTPAESSDFFTLVDLLDTFANEHLRVVAGLDTVEQMRGATLGQRYAIRSALWKKPELLDAFVSTGRAPPALHDDARQLRYFVRGRFFCERVLKRHAICISMTSPAAVYAVEGLRDGVDEVLSRNSPSGVAVMFDATLIPWRGRIVWDGLVSVLPIYSGPGIRRSFKAEYTRAKDRGAILTTLGDAPPAVKAKPPRPITDWRPAVGEIAKAADALGKAETTLQSASFTLLRASAGLADAALANDHDAAVDAARKVLRAYRKVVANLEG